MTVLIPDAEKAAMAAMAETWLAQVKPYVLAEGELREDSDADLAGYLLTAKAATCLFVAQPGVNLCALFTALGFTLGAVYAQQGDELKPFLDDALDRAITAGMEASTAARRPMGSA